jgi:hypothetical protein
MSLYDRLTNKLDDDDEQPAGLSPLDIADLPGDQRKVMFALLRDTKAATQGIDSEELATNLENPENLQDTVAELVKSGWLIEMGEAPNFRYKVNIRRKRSSTIGLGIWSSLSERITSRMAEFEDEPPQPQKRPALSSDYLDSITNDAEESADSTEGEDSEKAQS